jgi:hypothetical protein
MDAISLASLLPAGRATAATSGDYLSAVFLFLAFPLDQSLVIHAVFSFHGRNRHFRGRKRWPMRRRPAHRVTQLLHALLY